MRFTELRIVGGSARGRVLAAPKSQSIRPTADRVRETIFNILGQRLDPLDVLDLFAGTGALGLEAISRGAARAVLVDQGREAQALARANAETLGFSDRVEMVGTSVEAALPRLAERSSCFELVFADPPYASRLGTWTLERLGALGLVAPGGWVVVEHDDEEELAARIGPFGREDQRAFGPTRVSFYRLTPGDGAP